MRALAISRDAKLLDLVIKHRYITARQAGELLFKNIVNDEYREDKTAYRLLQLYRRRLLHRFKIGGPFIYSTSPRYSPKTNHFLAITDVLINILAIKPESSSLQYEIETKQGDCLTDLLLVHHEPFRSRTGHIYIEVELDSTGSIVDKIRKYEELLGDEKNNRLVVVCKHRRTIDKIEKTEFDIPVKTIELGRVKEGWEW